MLLEEEVYKQRQINDDIEVSVLESSAKSSSLSPLSPFPFHPPTLKLPILDKATTLLTERKS
jgi:hypothetical protein